MEKYVDGFVIPIPKDKINECLSEKGDNLSRWRAADRVQATIYCCQRLTDSDFHILLLELSMAQQF